jgi:hypothetical protein
VPTNTEDRVVEADIVRARDGHAILTKLTQGPDCVKTRWYDRLNPLGEVK